MSRSTIHEVASDYRTTRNEDAPDRVAQDWELLARDCW